MYKLRDLGAVAIAVPPAVVYVPGVFAAITSADSVVVDPWEDPWESGVLGLLWMPASGRQNLHGTPSDINDAGQISLTKRFFGLPSDPSGVVHAFRMNNDASLVALPELPDATESSAKAINSAGDVVGYCSVPIPPHSQAPTIASRQTAVLWPAQGPFVPLDDLPSDWPSSEAWDVNAHRVVIGISSGLWCIWRPGEPPQALPPVVDGGAVRLSAINDKGMVVGSEIYGTTITTVAPQTYLLGDTVVPYVWTEAGGPAHLRVLSEDGRTAALEVNASGHVVGFGRTANSATPHALLWVEGNVYDVNRLLVPRRPDWEILAGLAINDTDTIVGVGVVAGDPNYHVCLLEPTRLPVIGPLPFPWRGPRFRPIPWYRWSPLTRDVVLALALHEVAYNLHDEVGRAELQRAALAQARRALDLLAEDQREGPKSRPIEAGERPAARKRGK